jgi:hypothetical protein
LNRSRHQPPGFDRLLGRLELVRADESLVNIAGHVVARREHHAVLDPVAGLQHGRVASDGGYELRDALLGDLPVVGVEALDQVGRRHQPDVPVGQLDHKGHGLARAFARNDPRNRHGRLGDDLVTYREHRFSNVAETQAGRAELRFKGSVGGAETFDFRAQGCRHVADRSCFHRCV